ncbi:MAG: ABC transporter ATP-binding protein [Thermoanaerobaculia bacterium]
MGASAGDLLSVAGLRTYFPFGRRWFGKGQWVRAVDGVDLRLRRGEILGLVGESGCGKTTLGRSLLRLVEPTGGAVQFDGIDLLVLKERTLRAMRRRMQIVFQDPYASLSPRRQIRQILAEPLLLHRLVAKHAIEKSVAALLVEVGLEPYFMHRYPHEMSGGQRQRIAIARALALEPAFLVADEPVSALDVSVRAQILNILLELQRKRGIAMLFISHDLAVVERIADRVAVMYLGKIVEEAEAGRLMESPLHPYTQALLSSVPVADPGAPRKRIRLTGELPSPIQPILGCPFASRCPEVQDLCREVAPPLEPKREGHRVACHFR